MEPRALLIEFDPATGDRAGGINPKDPQLPCHGWQDLESLPAREIRLVQDDRNLDGYTDTPGVTVFTGRDAINAAIEKLKPEVYEVEDKELLFEDMRQRGIVLSEFAGKSRQELLKSLAEKGLVGLKKISARKI